jgi:hypothetical protein
MIEEQYQVFPRTHDPDDSASRNIDIGGVLRRVGGTYQSVTIELDSSCSDSELAISLIAYDTTTQLASFRITGGNRTATCLDSDGVTRVGGYLIRCTVYLTDGRHYDQSFIQLIRQH